MPKGKLTSPVRYGVVGVGGMGKGHCRNLGETPDACLTAVCDIIPAVAEEVGKLHNVPYFVKHTGLIASGLCDAVIVSTPHPEHPRVAIDAMKAGLHLLCEKPLSERVSTADKILAAARETGVAFCVDFQKRTQPVFIKAMEIVRNGELGRVFRTAMICPNYRTQGYYDSGGWRATWAYEGGGVMMNQSPHDLDIFYLLGGKPASVFGRVETRLHDIEVEDVAEAMLTYPDGGTGYFHTSTIESGPGYMIEVFGDKGKLVYRDNALRFYRFDTPITEFTRTCPDMWNKPKCVEVPLEIPKEPKRKGPVIYNFTRHLLYGEPLAVPGETAIHSLEIANAVWLSAHLGKPVTLPISRRAYDIFLAKKRRESTFVKKVGKKVKALTDPSLV